MTTQSIALRAYRKALVAYLRATDVIREAVEAAEVVEQQQMKAFMALGRERGLVTADDQASDPGAAIELQVEEMTVALKELGWDEDHPVARAAYSQLRQLRREVELYEQLQATQLNKASGDGPVL